MACVFKMESHNHPSYIEPYQGATTGVGGILRDVFTMGARPIACLNALRFGDPAHPRTRHLVSGVVAGIGGYGNSFGVPTVGGQMGFHTRYDGNILVNAMAVGIAKADEIFYAKATGIGNPIVYLGSKTGRDGIHGATMASAEFDDKSEEKRPTVQVGDPFAEKLLLEACLELMQTGSVIAIQDMGAAGLTCSAVEMGAKGDLGIELDLDAVPCREAGMTAYEMMLSESQERMLMVLDPAKEKQAEAISVKWGLDFAIIGKTTDTLRFVVKHKGEVMADLPIKELGDEAPLYDRPHIANTHQPVIAPGSVPAPISNDEALLRLVGSPGSLLQALGLGAVRPPHPRQHRAAAGRRRRARARAGRAEGPRAHLRRDAALLRGRPGGGRQAGRGGGLAQHHRRGRPAARHHRQPQFRQSGTAGGDGPARRLHPRHRRGLRSRWTSRSSPATSRSTTRPTAAASCPRPPSAASACSTTSPSMPASRSRRRGRRCCSSATPRAGSASPSISREIAGREEGAPPPVDLAVERRNGDFVRGLIRAGRVDTVHDCSDGGLAVALGRNGDGRRRRRDDRRAAGGIPRPRRPVRRGPGPLRAGRRAGRGGRILQAQARSAGIPALRLGVTGGDTLTLPGERAISIAALRSAHESWLPDYMAGRSRWQGRLGDHAWRWTRATSSS